MSKLVRVREQAAIAYHEVRLRLLVANLLCRLLPRYSLSTVRAAIYRAIGVKLAPHVSVLAPIDIAGSGKNPFERLVVGEHSIISSGLFGLEGTITIGRGVMIAHYVRIYTAKHQLGPSERRFSPSFTPAPVVIEDGVWVGTGAIILPGVRIGRGAVISAGSVVNRDVPPNTLVSGVPAAVIKQLDDREMESIGN